MVLILALCAAFTATPALAEYIASVQAACHGQMPCCPVSGGGMGCSHPQCGAVARIHAELVTTVRESAPLVPAGSPHRRLASQQSGPTALAADLPSHRSPVFRLKEDLRI